MKNRDKIAKYAYTSSVFYRDLIGYKEIEDDSFAFEELPYISKEMFVESRLPIEPMSYLLENSEENVITMSTSGSTGKYLQIKWNKDDYIRSMLPLWIMRKRYYGIKPDDKMCYFYTIHKTGKEEVKEVQKNNTYGFSKTDLTDERLLEIYKKIENYKPKWMLLQPSTAMMLVDTAEKHGLSQLDSVEYIELSGEMLSEKLKCRLNKFFKCSIANQYGSYEFNSIAYEFQIIQKGIDMFQVRMCIDGMSETEEIKRIFETNILEERLKNATYEYSFSKEYLNDAFGDKLMYFRREDREH